MDRFAVRQQQRKMVESAYRDLHALLGGDFSPGYFNRPEVLDAERSGLAVCDGVLGHVLRAPRTSEEEAEATALLRAVGDALVPDEVENRCHNLHSAVMLMLDRIGCPAIVVWGSVHASALASRGFVLNAGMSPRFPGHRPGHAWIMTPYWSVTDLALAYGYNVGDDYERLAPSIPKLVQIRTRESSEPDREWWRLPSSQPFVMDDAAYAHATKYLDLVGWSQDVAEDVTLCYLPGAMAVPEEPEMNDVSVQIGGRPPGDFLAEYLSRSRLSSPSS